MIALDKPASRGRGAALAITLTALLGSACGCSKEAFPVVSVTGTVTLDGEPLPNALVGFEPRSRPGESLAGPGSFARTDDQGRYDLVAIDKRPGAVVGEHRVTIRTFEAETSSTGDTVVLTKERLPAKYHDRSELTFEVPQRGTQKADFLLTSD